MGARNDGEISTGEKVLVCCSVNRGRGSLQFRPTTDARTEAVPCRRGPCSAREVRSFQEMHFPALAFFRVSLVLGCCAIPQDMSKEAQVNLVPGLGFVAQLFPFSSPCAQSANWRQAR
jgi:hypothetical protein